VGHLADSLRELAQIADRVGVDTGSHEASRLAHAAEVAAGTLELAVMVAGANPAEMATTYWSVSLGGGSLQAPEREPAGELAVSGGFLVTGPRCTMLDAGVRASLATRYGPTLAQSGRLCFGAVELEPEQSTADNKVEFLALNAYESIGLNVRPSVDAAAVTDSRRYALAEGGLSAEGLRWYWHQRRWSVAAPWVALSGSILARSVEGDLQWLTRVTAAAWFGELRYHRDGRQLTDFALRFLPIAADTIESGQAINTLSLVPFEMIGLGAYGVYVDAQGGLDLTAEKDGDTPAEIASKPDLGIGSWRLALRLGVPRLNAQLISRQRLLPTLDEGAVAEKREGATLHVDLGRMFLDGEAYRAHLRLYHGPGDVPDQELDTWGVQGEAWIRAGRHLLVGTTVEVGRSFVFAEPALPGAGAPRFGHLVLAQVGWRASSTQRVD